jgi:hypothetical protein
MVAEWAVEDAEEVAEEQRRRAAALALWDRTHSGQAQAPTIQIVAPSMSTPTAAEYEDADPDEFYRTVVSTARAAVAGISLHGPHGIETLEAAGARILLLEATVEYLVKLMSKSYSKKKAAAAPLCE